MRSKAGPVRARGARRTPAPSIRAELTRRGVGEGFARAVSEQLEPFAAELPPDHVDAVIAGVALAWGVHRRSVEAFRRTATDLEEVQRLLASFAGELHKLDEALETLAAYAARLRTTTRPPPGRTVH
jgi:hypothetical protein